MQKSIVSIVLGFIIGVSGSEISFEFFDANSAAYFPVSGLSSAVITNNGLVVSFSVNTGTMNRVGSYGFGITSGVTGNSTSAIDPGESLLAIFDHDVEITALDFRQFTAGEVFNVIFDSADHLITRDDLTQKVSAIYSGIHWFIAAGTAVEFTVIPGSSISLDGFTVTVVPEPEVTGLTALALAAGIFATRRLRRRQI
ncbi:MAG: hypothetical protein WC959_10865 [Kiritimatiellales bacterium]